MAIELLLKEYFILESRYRRTYHSDVDCFLTEKLGRKEYGPYDNYVEAESILASLRTERKAGGWSEEDEKHLFLIRGYDRQEIGYYLNHRTKILFSSESLKEKL